MRYEPHDYQQHATRFITDNTEAAILLGMGLGKSVITLTALWELLLDSFLVRRVLVVAPLRVARDTWPGELVKWDHLNGLADGEAAFSQFVRLHRGGVAGPRRRQLGGGCGQVGGHGSPRLGMLEGWPISLLRRPRGVS